MKTASDFPGDADDKPRMDDSELPERIKMEGEVGEERPVSESTTGIGM
jgi:hypothetical protein